MARRTRLLDSTTRPSHSALQARSSSAKPGSTSTASVPEVFDAVSAPDKAVSKTGAANLSVSLASTEVPRKRVPSVRVQPRSRTSVSATNKSTPASRVTGIASAGEDGDFTPVRAAPSRGDLAVDLRPSKDIKHVRCATERELSKEFDAIHRVLSDMRGDWDQRMRALKRLQGLVLGSIQVEQFIVLVLRLREQLVAHVQDLRSAICREACSVLFLLVHALGAEFEPLAIFALPALFRITVVTVQVIADSGFQCISAIVRECRTCRVLGVLVEHLRSRSGVQRWRCTQALLLALQTHPVNSLDKHVDALELCIKQSLEDAREDVRSCGRLCYWAFHDVFEDRGTRLYVMLDGAKQRALDAVRPLLVAQSDNATDDQAAVTVDGDAREATQDLLHCASVLDVPDVVYAPTSLSRDADAQGDVEISAEPSTHACSRDDNLLKAGTGGSRRSLLSQRSDPGDSHEPALGPRDVDVLTDATENLGNEIYLNSNQVSLGANVECTSAGDIVAEVDADGDSSCAGVLKGSSTRQRKQPASFRPTPRNGAAASQRAAGSLGISPSAARRSSQRTGQSATKANEVKLANFMSAQLFRQANSEKNPMQRAAALLALEERILLCGSDKTNVGDNRLPPLDELLELVLGRLGDAPPVVAAALSTLRALLAFHPAACAPQLSRILAALGDGSTNGLAYDSEVLRSCLMSIVEHQQPESLFSALQTTLREQPTCAIVTFALLENAISSVAFCENLVRRKVRRDGSDSPELPMHAILDDVSRVATSLASDEVRHVAARALQALYECDRETFTSGAVALSRDYQESLCNLVGDAIPDLRERLSCDTEALAVEPGGSTVSSGPASLEVQEHALPRRALREFPGKSSVCIGNQKAPESDVVVNQPSISGLLTHCDPSTLKTTLRALARAAKLEGPESWDKHFGRVLILVLDSLGKTEADDPGVREAALLCLQELIAHLPGCFNDFAEVVASKLFETYVCLDEPDMHVAFSVDRSLERLLGVIEPPRALEILLPLIQCNTSQQLQAATRLLSPVLLRMPSRRVLECLHTFLPGVVRAFGHSSSEVRKTAVFCLVDVYMILGEEVMPYFVKDLTPSQMKLVTLYISRQRREREELRPFENNPHGEK